MSIVCDGCGRAFHDYRNNIDAIEEHARRKKKHVTTFHVELEEKTGEEKDPIIKVYERFKHLDQLLSNIEANPMFEPLNATLRDLWKSVKEYAETEEL